MSKRQIFLRSHGLLDDKNLPSHDLFRWLLLHLDKSVFSHILCAWLDSFASSSHESAFTEKRFIHIDGKVLRATRNQNILELGYWS